ncbi:hypothetical protein CYLTODRAFT_492123 [Cylindrobasidium torrendii FP15055 ss-10]|uniref:Uncharacterized protein n=1 Tax=Cylindrobasidium torrendii FP15055 ss-10 TaxID=1314674 RepID=A0A0D7B662_9AGAR|nr:hypothetical protein CYLTODRAFT_492123 [Cylindrobasidium torrendii FP15055 ss-10]
MVGTPEKLDVKRVNRILRRLRSACSILSRHQVKPHRARATYASSARPLTTNDGPLTFLPPPNSNSIFAQDHIDLSRKLYAVRDAFREVVRNANPPQASIPTLAGLCAIVVGTNIECEPDSSEESDQEEEEDEDMAEVLYENVPPSLRGITLLSHATTIIQSTCPSSATLYRICMDVALDADLPYESETFLRALLQHAFDASGNAPPISYPLHTRFLTEVSNVWLYRNPQTYVLRTPTRFVDILQSALANTTDPDVWDCDALDYFLQNFKSDRAGLVLDLSFPILDCLQQSPVQARRQLEKKLALWLSTYLLPSAKQFYPRIAQLVSLCYDLRVDERWRKSLQDVLVCLASDLLPHQPNSKITALLRELEPQDTTYVALVKHIFATSSDSMSERCTFVSIASSLEAEQLVPLEMSFWQCVSTHARDEFRHDPAELESYMAELMDLLEDAEMRCEKRDADYRWDPIGCWIPSDGDRAQKRRKTGHRRNQSDTSTTSSPFVSLLQRRASQRVDLNAPSPYPQSPFVSLLQRRRARDAPSSGSTVDDSPLPETPFVSLLQRRASGRVALHADSPVHTTPCPPRKSKTASIFSPLRGKRKLSDPSSPGDVFSDCVLDLKKKMGPPASPPRRPRIPVEFSSPGEPSSDDPLDLLAHS